LGVYERVNFVRSQVFRANDVHGGALCVANVLSFTTHYSAPDIAELVDAAERVCESRKTPEPRLVEMR
jgi:hypothetical protein